PNAVLPDSGPLATGIFKPTTCETPVTNFPAPAPAGPYVEPGCVVARTNAQSLYGNFAGVTANGTWNLYIRDDNGVARPENVDELTGELKGGWGIELLPSTATGIDISGRVLSPDGRGLRNATVTITDPQGNRRTATTGSFGYYKFFDVEAGSSVVMEVRSNRYRFSSRLVQVLDTITDLDFSGIE
ncbi:MAG TPA: carboxypeptidase-like regulatory domain-containing protein, partial [Pyrinomonadaceae bacterium]|nr:carboxypeptidase-like regulatory domain-containing protein [Pyrinomonadaceae bacterium]